MLEDPSYTIFQQSIKALDKYLQAFTFKPEWSIEEELLKGPKTSRLNTAEFSQPLCTAVPASAPSGIEVDVIFPIYNATYNITKSLPIVFALQNLTAAAALGPFSFSWDIMPYGYVGENQEPGGVTNDYWTAKFDAANTTTEPYILVNQTDVQKWQFGPNYPYSSEPYYPNGSVYALQWFMQWDVAIEPCDSDPLGMFGWVFFNINMGDMEPDLENLVGKCPQLGAVYEFNTTALNKSCSAVVSSNGTSNPCAVTVDKAMVRSISSAVQSLITASAAAASASATNALPTVAYPTAKHNIAVSSNVRLRYYVVAIFLLGSLQMVMFL